MMGAMFFSPMPPADRVAAATFKPSRSLPSTRDARALAAQRLPRLIYDFIDGGAGDELGLASNLSDLQRVRLQPRSLAEVNSISLKTSLLGRDWDVPFGIAPMGMCDLAWPGTDHSLAALSQRHNLPLGVSTASSTSLEELLRLTGGRAWFQLYVTGSTQDALALSRRAATAGYDTLILTVDVPRLGKRPRDVRNGFATPFRMTARHFMDFATHPHWSLKTLASGPPTMANFSGANARGYDRNAPRTGANWAFLQELRAAWRGKLIIKGVLSAEDAVQMKTEGVDAICVSNHGGRQLDSAPSAIAALPAIRQAVGPTFPLLFDSGIRTGDDMVKARALGADMVLVGRPFLYALAAVGPAGAERMFSCFTGEIETALAQIGVAAMSAVTPACLYSAPVAA
jgi:L-lactate dehydrogenase (cytochrome)